MFSTKMQKTVSMIDYNFDGDYVLIQPPIYPFFRDSAVVGMIYHSSIPTYDRIKIPFDVFQTKVQQKSLVIFSNFDVSIDARRNGYDHQRKLIESNKNMCFGCMTVSLKYCGRCLDMNHHVPDGISKFVVLHPTHNVYEPYVNFDLRGLVHLQHLYHCFVVRLPFGDTIYDIHNDDKSVVRYDNYDFKLPYGCTTKIIENFNEVVEQVDFL